MPELEIRRLPEVGEHSRILPDGDVKSGDYVVRIKAGVHDIGVVVGSEEFEQAMLDGHTVQCNEWNNNA